MPIDKGAVRIRFPRPDVQCAEGWEPKAIGAFEIVEELPLKLWCNPWVSFVPSIGKEKVVSGDQTELATGQRLIDHNLRARWIDFAIRGERWVI